ncbi:hypothetical protein SAMN04490244_12035 [Tranquillimonas rosea]|uniref:Metanogen output domain-containing protein n=1 Tax=Tranquillimonas rosea TaxID=641238 RepID=A0A1H9X8F0_9RHOB|nr:methanogen output domain 1-containing protein [Tranquillimonas rosea]SES42402.1 hypothetical protein SAMN04490244_12035 [Tranquillimonas rosea]
MLAPDDIDFRSFSDRETFTLDLLTTLADILETAIGRDDAEGFIDLVANRLGRDFSAGLDALPADPQAVADTLIALKRRIDGDFRVERAEPREIILTNTRCPFGDRVKGRPSLCAMTSGVFGRVAADKLGFARVRLEQTIASGHPCCRVVIRPDSALAETAPGPEEKDYFAQTGTRDAD